MIIYFVIIIIIIVMLVLLTWFTYVYTGVDTVYFYRLDHTNVNEYVEPIKPILDIAEHKEYKLQKSNSYKESNFIMFKSLNQIDEFIHILNYPKNVKYIYGINGTDLIVSKSILAYILVSHYKSNAFDIIPTTYIPSMFTSKSELIQKLDNRTLYILKKNIQRQEGIVISTRNDLNKLNLNDFVVIQELLQDPFIHNKRKINIRIYLLVIVKKNRVSIYIYNNGFMYYTPKYFKPMSTDIAENITTGYIDRQVYVENPLTLHDFYKVLSINDANKLQTNIKLTIQKCMMAYIETIKTKNKNIPGTKFSIFGCDIAPSSDLNVKIMEINKGPDLSYKDKRDGDLKYNLVLESLMMVNMIKSKRESNFIKLFPSYKHI